jgi:AP-1 complex subunit mu
VERFSGHVLEADEADERPVWLEHGTTYIYIKYNNLYIMAVTQRNSNAAMILLFLYRMVEVLKDYFRELEEESIRDNFVITYELMDEMMDFGYPQISEAKILREYITQEAHKLEVVKPPMAVTNAVSWRSEGIKHRKNEIFLDVVERLNLLVAANGTLLRSEILGSLKMRSYLSGMPELKLGLNDKLLFEATGRRTGGRGVSKGKAVEMEDIKFHQCVRLARFENDRTISFIPPDGEFELMSYRLNTQVGESARRRRICARRTRSGHRRPKGQAARRIPASASLTLDCPRLPCSLPPAALRSSPCFGSRRWWSPTRTRASSI